tara:strand:- start:3062 stop:3229 length:168 start_codon:yes stop_codon:yes gene_type:complete
VKVGDLVEHVMRREVGIITGNAHGNAYGQTNLWCVMVAGSAKKEKWWRYEFEVLA